MAKYEYKPLTAAKRKSSNVRYLIAALVIIIVGTVVLIKTRGMGTGGRAGEDPVGTGGVDETTYVLPPGASDPPVAPAGADPSRTAAPPKPAESTAVSPRANTATTNNTPPVAFNPVPHPTVNMPEATLGLIEKALEQLKSGHVIAARDSLNAVLPMEITAKYRASVQQKLTELAEQWLFTKTVFPGDMLTEMYTVQPGEVLENIGKRYNVPYEVLQKINGVPRPELLQAGQKIKVIKGPFHVTVYRSTFTMDLYLGSQMYVKSYRVGLGAVDSETPTGRWRVKAGGKAVKPMWTDPRTQKVYHADAPDYPLGSRYMELEGLDKTNKDRTGIAVHGTKDPQSIGARASLGCIRLFNGDAIELYNLLVEGKSEVRIVD